MARVVIPKPIVLNSTNIAGSGYAEWASGTTYSAGQKVKVSKESDGTTARFPVLEFEATGATTGDYPPTASIDKWVELGAQNAHKMFDGRNNSRTIGTTTIEVNLTAPTRTSYVALIGLRNVSLVEMTQTYAGDTVKHETRDLEISYIPVGHFSWLFGEAGSDRIQRRSAVFELPGYYPGNVLTITLTGVNPECGLCICGPGFHLGDTQFEAEPELKDFSIFEQNDFGTTTHVPRQTVRLVRGTLWVPTVDYDRVYSIFETYMPSLAFYDFNNEDEGPYHFDSLRVYGKMESFSGGIAYNQTPINLKISGMD